MIFWLSAGLVVAALAALFALQNAVPVAVQFLKWRFTGSLALVLLSTFSAGVAAGIFVLIPSFLRRRWRLRALQKELRDMGDEPPSHSLE